MRVKKRGVGERSGGSRQLSNGIGSHRWRRHSDLGELTWQPAKMAKITENIIGVKRISAAGG